MHFSDRYGCGNTLIFFLLSPFFFSSLFLLSFLPFSFFPLFFLPPPLSLSLSLTPLTDSGSSETSVWFLGCLVYLCAELLGCPCFTKAFFVLSLCRKVFPSCQS